MKRSVCLIIAVALLVGLAGCKTAQEETIPWEVSQYYKLENHWDEGEYELTVWDRKGNEVFHEQHWNGFCVTDLGKGVLEIEEFLGTGLKYCTYVDLETGQCETYFFPLLAGYGIICTLEYIDKTERGPICTYLLTVKDIFPDGENEAIQLQQELVCYNKRNDVSSATSDAVFGPNYDQILITYYAANQELETLALPVKTKWNP